MPQAVVNYAPVAFLGVLIVVFVSLGARAQLDGLGGPDALKKRD